MCLSDCFEDNDSSNLEVKLEVMEFVSMHEDLAQCLAVNFEKAEDGSYLAAQFEDHCQRCQAKFLDYYHFYAINIRPNEIDPTRKVCFDLVDMVSSFFNVL